MAGRTWLLGILFVLAIGIGVVVSLAAAQPGGGPPAATVAPTGQVQVVVNSTPISGAGPLKLGIVQPEWLPVQLPAQALGASEEHLNTLDQQAYINLLTRL